MPEAPGPLVLALLAAICGPALAQDPSPMELFDGASLEGWRTVGDPAGFRVEEGAILATGSEARLVLEPRRGGLLRNAELEVEIGLQPGAELGLSLHHDDSGSGRSEPECRVRAVPRVEPAPRPTPGLLDVPMEEGTAIRWVRVRFGHREGLWTLDLDGRRIQEWPSGDRLATGGRAEGTLALAVARGLGPVRLRGPRLRRLPDLTAESSRADRAALRTGAEFHERMDFGPALALTLGRPGSDHVVPKALCVELAPDRSASYVFDTDLLRPAWGFSGWIRLRGVAYDGAHGPHSTVPRDPLLETRPGPGFSRNGSLADPRPVRAGPLPREHGRFRGFTRQGERVILEYEVQGAPVRELPGLGTGPDGTILVRALEVGPLAEEVLLLVQDLPAGAFRLEDPATARADALGGHRVVALAGDGPILALGGVAGQTGPRLLARIPRGGARFALAHGRGDLEAVRAAAARGLRDLQEAGASPEATRGGLLWPGELVTEAREGSGTGPYAVDDVSIPFENPWHSEMRIGAFDIFPDGDRAALCTWNGDVWIVRGLLGIPGPISWKRFAAGLFEPLGLLIDEGQVLVCGRDQITRLVDADGDGEADRYECVTNEVQASSNFHEFVFDLQRDATGDLYFAKAGPVKPGGRGFDPILDHHGTILRYRRREDRLEVFARGFRAPNGIGVSPTGQLTAGDNEGSWVPHCKLHWVRPGGFHGVVPLAGTPEPPADYVPPLCWFPMDVDNSGGGQAWIPDDRFGPFAGDLLHLSYGQSAIYKVMKDEVPGVVQGAVFRLPVSLPSSAMRARFHPLDGQLWVSGLRGWQTNAARLSGFSRVRRTAAPIALPRNFRVRPGAIELEFTCALDRGTAEDPTSYAVEQWNYVWGPQYGSPEVSAAEPDPVVLERALRQEMQDHRHHDRLEVARVELLEGGCNVRLHIPALRPVMQIRIGLDLESEDGRPIVLDIHGTIHRVPER
jgi:hypothetical protein